jgi:hypothetical protein
MNTQVNLAPLCSTLLLTSSNLMRGWSKVLPGWTQLSKGQMQEATYEFAGLLAEIKEFRKRRSKLIAAGSYTEADEMRNYGHNLADRVQYTYKAWLRAGEYTSYYEVASGVIHNTVFCRTINEHTSLAVQLRLTGKTVEQVQGGGHRICNHCRKRTPEALARKVERGMADWVQYLEGPG